MKIKDKFIIGLEAKKYVQWLYPRWWWEFRRRVKWI